MKIVEAETASRYVESGWWSEEALHETVKSRALESPHSDAFVTPSLRSTWAEYDALADDAAALLVALGLDRGQRVALQLPDGVLIHAALVGAARAGLISVGIGARAGRRELAHLICKTGSRTLITAPLEGQESSLLIRQLRELGAGLSYLIQLSETGVHAVFDVSGPGLERIEPGRADVKEVSRRSVSPSELSMLNSTSGTTGLPKCVTQFDNRWIAFSKLAIEAGELTSSDVFMGAVPAPFGFGLWTSHYAPALLGVPTVAMPKFDVGTMLRMIEQERVTVLCCVSTQFRMLLNSPLADKYDLSSLRVMFTGGESVSADRAAEFEVRTGAKVLQFFGSNETGALSFTRVTDTKERRLKTSGKLIPEMEVRLFDGEGQDITDSGGPGIPGGRGPLACAGYYDDAAANRQLFTKDGWMLMGDLVVIRDGYLTPVGRTSDLIIRGGKNISASMVEEEVETHPAVDLAGVVAIPDEVFGERVCAVVSLIDGMDLTLSELVQHLSARGVSKEIFPEHLVVVDNLPRSSGGKLAKKELAEISIKSLRSASLA